MFETTGIIDSDLLKELKYRLLSPTFNVLLIGSCAACCVLLVLTVLYRLYWYAFFLAFMIALIAIVLYADRIWIRNIAIKTNINHLRESTGREDVRYTTSFGEDGVCMENHGTHAKVTMEYGIFVRFVDAPSVYALFTKSGQFVFVFKRGLDEKQRAAFIEYIKAQPTQIKWQPTKNALKS